MSWGTALGVAGLVALVQLGGLWLYYQTEIAAGRSNDGPWRMVRLVEEQRRAREPFVVHSDLHLLPTGGGGTWAKAMDYLLELEDVRKDVSPREDGATAAGLRRDDGGAAVRRARRAAAPGPRRAAPRAVLDRAAGAAGRRAARRSWAGRTRGAVLAALGEPLAVRSARPDVRDRLRVRPGARVAWLAAALVFVAFWMSRSLWPALDPNVVQDDARQHVFWMQRLVDPTLLQDDLFADYFASQAPAGVRPAVQGRCCWSPIR